MKLVAILKETPGNTFGFHGKAERTGKVIVAYLRSPRGKPSYLELKTPETEEEMQTIEDSVKRMNVAYKQMQIEKAIRKQEENEQRTNNP